MTAEQVELRVGYIGMQAGQVRAVQLQAEMGRLERWEYTVPARVVQKPVQHKPLVPEQGVKECEAPYGHFLTAVEKVVDDVAC